MGEGPHARERGEEEEEDEGVELNLGLSLGGRFRVDKHANNKKLVRSSSIVGAMPLLWEEDTSTDAAPPPPTYATLLGASLSPVETKEEWRKQKSCKCSGWRPRGGRLEKQRVSKSERDVGAGGSEEVEGAGVGATMRLNRFGSTKVAAPSFGLPS